jgi:hypothetical protein
MYPLSKIPPDYTRFAVNEDGWELWVPPATERSMDVRLRRYAFWHPGTGTLGRYGPEPCVSAGAAVVNGENDYFFTNDVQNDFSPHQTDNIPVLRGFLVIWFTYLRSIAGTAHPGVEIGNANDHLGKFLLTLGFKVGSNGTDYLGSWTDIAAKVKARRTADGWS